MILNRPMMAPTVEQIQQAREHVALAVRMVTDQRIRVQRLHRSGHSTVNATALLATFEEVLLVLRQHLTTEEGL